MFYKTKWLSWYHVSRNPQGYPIQCSFPPIELPIFCRSQISKTEHQAVQQATAEAEAEVAVADKARNRGDQCSL